MNAPLQHTPETHLALLAQAIDRRADLAALEFALSVGRLIIQGLYGGSLSAWRARRGREHSFRQLARLTRVSAPVLYRSVAIYELSCRIDVTRWELPMSHLRSVIGLPESEQRRLLSAARREGWTAHRMAEECTIVRQRGRSRRGRPPGPPVLKGIGHIERAAEKVAALPADTLTAPQRQEAIRRLDQQIGLLTAMRQQLTTAPGSPGTASADPAAPAARRSLRR